MIGLIACDNDETCRKIRYATMNVYFFNDTINATTGDTVQVAVKFDSIIVHGIKSDLIDVDSIIKVTSASSVHLPLNQLDSASTFAIKYNNNIFDTLKIIYTNKYQYLSLECGTLRVHHLDSVINSNNYFYKVKIINPEVNVTTTSSNAQNITIHHLVD